MLAVNLQFDPTLQGFGFLYWRNPRRFEKRPTRVVFQGFVAHLVLYPTIVVFTPLLFSDSNRPFACISVYKVAIGGLVSWTQEFVKVNRATIAVPKTKIILYLTIIQSGYETAACFQQPRTISL